MPKCVDLNGLLRVLQNLLAEEVPVRDMRTIAECLTQHAPRTQDPDALTAAVRVALGRAIVQNIGGNAPELSLIALEPGLEQILQSLIRGTPAAGSGGSMALEPGMAEALQRSIRETVERQEANGEPAILVVSPDVRIWLSRWLRAAVRGLHVLAYTEIPDTRKVRVVATIGRNDLEASGSPARAPLRSRTAEVR